MQGLQEVALELVSHALLPASAWPRMLIRNQERARKQEQLRDQGQSQMVQGVQEHSKTAQARWA